MSPASAPTSCFAAVLIHAGDLAWVVDVESANCNAIPLAKHDGKPVDRPQTRKAVLCMRQPHHRVASALRQQCAKQGWEPVLFDLDSIHWFLRGHLPSYADLNGETETEVIAQAARMLDALFALDGDTDGRKMKLAQHGYGWCWQGFFSAEGFRIGDALPAPAPPAKGLGNTLELREFVRGRYSFKEEPSAYDDQDSREAANDEGTNTIPRTQPLKEAVAHILHKFAALKSSEVRPHQFDYAAAISDIFEVLPDAPVSHLTAEAGTGSGKSFAYLAAAIAHIETATAPSRVAISLYTKVMQNQLESDLTAYIAQYQPAWQMAVLKGATNYLCLLQWQSWLVGNPPASNPTAYLDSMFLLRWLDINPSGDMTAANFPKSLLSHPSPEQNVGLTSRCIGQACGYFSICPYIAARKKYREANLCVSNHALTLHHVMQPDWRNLEHGANEPDSDAATDQQGAMGFTHVIFDEAHNLFGTADEFFARAVSFAAVRDWTSAYVQPGNLPPITDNKALMPLARTIDQLVLPAVYNKSVVRDCLGAHARHDENATVLLSALQAVADAMLGLGEVANKTLVVLQRACQAGLVVDKQQAHPPHVLKEGQIHLQHAVGAPGYLQQVSFFQDQVDVLPLAFGILEHALLMWIQIPPDTPDNAPSYPPGFEEQFKKLWPVWQERCIEAPLLWLDLFQCLTRLEPTARDVALITAADEGFPGTGDIEVGIRRLQPMGEMWETHLVPSIRGLAYVSATITGLQNTNLVRMTPLADGHPEEAAQTVDKLPRLVHYQSPFSFDYPNLCRVLLVEQPSERRAAEATHARIFQDAFLASNGGGLGVFASNERMQTVQRGIAGKLQQAGIELHVARQPAADTAVMRFRQDANSCLLGSNTIRESLDIPGWGLRIAVLEGWLWQTPFDSLSRIRSDFNKNTYKQRDSNIQLARNIKQAFGRLIRTPNDMGVLVIIDTPTTYNRHLNSGLRNSVLGHAIPAGVAIERVGIDALAPTIREFFSNR